jgi:hypothetical protein
MQASTENSTSPQAMIVTTTESIPGTPVVKTIGQVFGLTVRSRSLGGNIAAFLKGLVRGEIGSYVKLNEDSRRQALDRMVQNRHRETGIPPRMSPDGSQSGLRGRRAAEHRHVAGLKTAMLPGAAGARWGCPGGPAAELLHELAVDPAAVRERLRSPAGGEAA